MSDESPQPAPFPSQGRIAAVDYGTVRIGVAVCDPDRIIASPLTVVPQGAAEQRGKAFCQLAAEERITGWIVGFPIHLSGTESKKSIEARKFAKWLQQTTDLPVRLFDERFSTAAADQRLAPSKLTNKGRKKRIDAVAAQVLLESFIESARHRSDLPGLALDEKAIGDAIED
ncbi:MULTISPECIES: Holliday junction resolvase RuvX [Rosistilla]|uniref:Putative pre-16S rRNA nuclease n=2 Tax=Rosistilla TaxID=2795779 RepID=A0A518IML9_9BACT|nr:MULTISPECIES: Holliday junction resolvase RuvX [Rosistilla]QDS86192.1 Putative Holliday junction resolvase [Rosistilla ulvae]QDV54338.1 Putative Holliday junction resolvase [Rosistilla oblonga]